MLSVSLLPLLFVILIVPLFLFLHTQVDGLPTSLTSLHLRPYRAADLSPFTALRDLALTVSAPDVTLANLPVIPSVVDLEITANASHPKEAKAFWAYSSPDGGPFFAWGGLERLKVGVDVAWDDGITRSALDVTLPFHLTRLSSLRVLKLSLSLQNDEREDPEAMYMPAGVLHVPCLTRLTRLAGAVFSAGQCVVSALPAGCTFTAGSAHEVMQLFDRDWVVKPVPWEPIF
jgi:hypothetical protein